MGGPFACPIRVFFGAFGEGTVVPVVPRFMDPKLQP